MEDGTSLEKGDGTSLEKGDGTSLEDLFRATAGYTTPMAPDPSFSITT